MPFYHFLQIFVFFCGKKGVRVSVLCSSRCSTHVYTTLIWIGHDCCGGLIKIEIKFHFVYLLQTIATLNCEQIYVFTLAALLYTPLSGNRRSSIKYRSLNCFSVWIRIPFHVPKPRAATDVATNIDILRLLKSRKASSRWGWKLSLIHISEPTRPY